MWIGKTTDIERACWAVLLKTLVILMVFGGCPVTFGQTQTYQEFNYTNAGTNITITRYRGLQKDVLIPSTIPDVGTVTTIGRQAFQWKSTFTNITIPATITSIEDSAFESCLHLAKIAIPNSVTNLGNRVFCSCLNLSKVTLGSSVKSIGLSAFESCPRLPDITIPSSVTNIGWGAFTWCSNLEAINVSIKNPQYSSLDGVLFDKNQTQIIQFPYRFTGTYSVPNSVTNIGDYAFYACFRLNGVTIPNNVATIGTGAFISCSSLTNVTIGKGMARMGDDVFYECRNLTSVYFQGDAPSLFGKEVFGATGNGFTIFYPAKATGWSTPAWRGYSAQPYEYPPVDQLPQIAVAKQAGRIVPAFRRLQVGHNYYLQVSEDMKTWNQSGNVFMATNTDQYYNQPFAVTNAPHLFFKLRSPP